MELVGPKKGGPRPDEAIKRDSFRFHIQLTGARRRERDGERSAARKRDKKTVAEGNGASENTRTRK